MKLSKFLFFSIENTHFPASGKNVHVSLRIFPGNKRLKSYYVSCHYSIYLGLCDDDNNG